MNKSVPIRASLLLYFLILMLFIFLESVADIKNKRESKRKKGFEKQFEFLINGDIIIKQGKQTHSIPLFKNKSNKSILVEAKIFGEKESFSGSKIFTATITSQDIFTLPVVRGAKDGYSEAGILISIDGRKLKNIRVATYEIKDWTQTNLFYETNKEALKKALIIKKPSFIVVDISKIDPSKMDPKVYNDNSGNSIDLVDPADFTQES
jgi:hypothetical protein